MSFLPKENIYGHAKRLGWIISHVHPGESLLEFGCGTGYMISRPLAHMGFAVVGVDLDDQSIAFGQSIYRREGLDPNGLMAIDLSLLGQSHDVIIASEVLEHIADEHLTGTLDTIRNRLASDGVLLVTVPNGYGWFEFESWLWSKVGIGRMCSALRIEGVVRRLKSLFIGFDLDQEYPATLANSPHVQNFTYSSIRLLLEKSGFKIQGMTGSVLVAGPLSNLLFTGIGPIMRLNCALGTLLPRIAAGYYLECRLPANVDARDQ